MIDFKDWDDEMNLREYEEFLDNHKVGICDEVLTHKRLVFRVTDEENIAWKSKEKYRIVKPYRRCQVNRLHFYTPAMDYDEYGKFIFSSMVKLHYMNPNCIPEIWEYYVTNINQLLYPFTKEELYSLVEEASLIEYTPPLFNVIFNPSIPISPITMGKISQKYRADAIRCAVEEFDSQMYNTTEMSQMLGVSPNTIRKYKKYKILKSSNTKNKVVEWRKLNPTKRQVDCRDELNVSIATVKRYWNV